MSLKKSEQTRKRIIRSAIRIIATKGIERATSREIAIEANVANGLVSRYIKTRETLFLTVMEEITNDAYLQIETAPEYINGKGKILWMIEKNLDYFTGNTDYTKCLVLFYYYAAVDKQLWEMNQRMNLRSAKRLAAYWKQHLVENNISFQSNKLIWQDVRILHSLVLSAVIKYVTLLHRKTASTYTKEVLSDFEVLVKGLTLQRT